MKNTSIRFILGEESKPRIELFKKNEYTVENSIFYEQYKLALLRISDFISNTEDEVVNRSDSNIGQLHYNNIFVFTGERGSGKTSCMLTINDLLIKGKYEEQFKNKNGENTESEEEKEKIAGLRDTTFIGCEIIDPAFFDQQHNILEILIGTLFKRFKDNEQNKTGKLTRAGSIRGDDELKKERLLKDFQHAKKDLSALTRYNSSIESGDSMQELLDLAAATNFKENIDNLIRSYLKYENGSSPKGSRLVLCIDDIDLNMSNAYTMVEQIRKYLNTPELIILMAIKMEQLANVIRINYYNDFSILLKKQENKSESKGRADYENVINTMVERYLIKLLPLNQRIYLPDTDNIYQRDILIYKKEKDGELEEKETLAPLRNDLLKLIYTKLRMLFFNTSRQTSYIVPTNLRELRNLIHMLYNLEDASDHKTAQKNLFFFKQYFINTWCMNNLDDNGQYILENMWEITSANTLNLTVLQLLKSRFSELSEISIMATEDERKRNTEADARNAAIGTNARNVDTEAKSVSAVGNIKNMEPEIKNVIANGNIMYNISLGDVLACIDWLDKTCYDDKDLKLLFAIKTFYSMKLYESFRYKNDLADEEIALRHEIINKNNLTGNQTAYGDIINGNFLNASYLDVAPYESSVQTLRVRRGINCEIVNNLLKFHSTTSNERNKEPLRKIFSLLYTEKKKENDNIISENKADTLIEIIENDSENLISPMIEFFMLTTSYVIDSGENTNNYRSKRRVYYNTDVYWNRKSVCFDILSIFYNLLDVPKTYSRYKNYNTDTLDWHKDKGERGENELSLYQSILKKLSSNTRKTSKPKKKFIPEEELKYKISFRNIEILEQISYLLQRNRPEGESNNLKVIKAVFDNLSKYDIPIYPKDSIKYDFFSAVSDLLSRIDNAGDGYKDLFDFIFGENKQE